MAARVIHFGLDDCHRLMVLQSAGYAVDNCGSLLQLRTCLATGAAADALLMSDAGGVQPHDAIALAKTRASLPVILFRSTNLAYEESGVDLIVPCLTPPEVWLSQVEALIQSARAPSTPLRRESADALDRPRPRRASDNRERARNPQFFPPQPFSE